MLLQLTAQDRIDGGISLLLRCPGYSPSNVDMNNIMIDVYFPPRELEEGGSDLRLLISKMIHTFGEHVVLPHLQRFEARCYAEGIDPPQPPGEPNFEILMPQTKSTLAAVTGVQLRDERLCSLPSPLPKRCNAHFRCRCCLSCSSSSSMSINHTPHLAMSPVKSQRIPHKAAISIGLNTNAALERLHLDNNLIPQLHILITTLPSNRWEAELQNSVWNLTHEEAFTVWLALQADVGTSRDFKV